MAVHGGRGVPIKQMLRCAESDSVRKAADTISNRLRRQCREEPSSGTLALFTLAHQNMEALRPKMDSARAFVAAAHGRRERGELDEQTLNAELAPVNMALALYGCLKIMLDRAGDKAAFQLIGWASGTLSRNVEEGGAILSKKTYPGNQRELRGSLVQGRRQLAMDLYHAVMRDDLKELSEKLQVSMLPPEFVVNAS